MFICDIYIYINVIYIYIHMYLRMMDSSFDVQPKLQATERTHMGHGDFTELIRLNPNIRETA